MSINLILGPMFSGKSSALIRKYRRHIVAGRRCLLVKADIDKRYDEGAKVCTHDLLKVDAIACSHLKDIPTKLEDQGLGKLTDYDVVCLDELQFFPDAVEECEKLANQYGIIVEASGLSGNFLREPFPVIQELIPKADTIVCLNSICVVCKADGAAFTQKIQLTDGEGTVAVGGSDKYRAVCRRCYITFLEKNTFLEKK